MKSTLTSLLRFVFATLPAALMLLGLNCSFPSYESPQPGVLEVHLKSKSSNILYTALNNFIVKVTQVQAVREDGARLTIYQDVKAIDRKTGVYNTLDSAAWYGRMVLGQGFAPPGRYIGINLLVEPGNQVVIDGYRFIPVITETGFNPLLEFSGDYEVRENGTTVIELTIDLDKSLQKGADNYYFRPQYFISAVR